MASNPLEKLAISPLLSRTRHPNNHRYPPLLALRLSSPHISSVRSYSKPITATAVAQASAASGDKPRKGSDVLVEALERAGVKVVFAYPGGASMDIHQALNRSPTIRNVFSRQERGGIFAAEGYARASGLPGVCIATSGSATVNFVSGLAHAMIDSVPIVAITGQDPSLETLIVEMTVAWKKLIYAETIFRITRK